jgi:hypothetical protein
MAILTRKPAKPIFYPPINPPPRDGFHYATGGAWTNGRPEDWQSIANRFSIPNVWDLILYNFQCRNPKEVNWCLQGFMGCTKSSDGKNFRFDPSDAVPVVYIPPSGFQALSADDIAARTLVLSVLARSEIAAINFKTSTLTVDPGLFKEVRGHVQTQTIICAGTATGVPGGVLGQWLGLENVMFVRNPTVHTITKEATVVHESVHAGHDVRGASAQNVQGEICGYIAEAIFALRASKVPLATFDPFAHGNPIRQWAAFIAKEALIHQQTNKVAFEVKPDFALHHLQALIAADPVHGPQATMPQADDGV